MAEDSAALVETEAAPSMDMDAAVDKISEGLFPEMETADPTPQETVAKALTEPKDNGTPTKTVQPIPALRQAPKSWPTDMHESWGKTDPKVQDYWELREKQMTEGLEQYKSQADYARSLYQVIKPYNQLLESKGLDAPRAIDDMLGAYSRLTQGTVEQRQAALMQIGKNLGIAMPANGSEPALPVDPRIQTLEQQFQQVNQLLTAQQESALQAARQKASAEVQTFASDPKNAFFDECHDDIVKFLKAGDSLQEAYDKAVWANPVTREKQKQAYFQTESEKAKERARLDALPKQKARGVNVKSQDTQRAPTEKLGSMEETLRATLHDIKERTIH